MIALVLAAAVISGVFIPWARRADKLDAVSFRYHTMHTARQGCVECKALGWDA